MHAGHDRKARHGRRGTSRCKATEVLKTHRPGRSAGRGVGSLFIFFFFFLRLDARRASQLPRRLGRGTGFPNSAVERATKRTKMHIAGRRRRSGLGDGSKGRTREVGDEGHSVRACAKRMTGARANEGGGTQLVANPCCAPVRSALRYEDAGRLIRAVLPVRSRALDATARQHLPVGEASPALDTHNSPSHTPIACVRPPAAHAQARRRRFDLGRLRWLGVMACNGLPRAPRRSE